MDPQQPINPNQNQPQQPATPPPGPAPAPNPGQPPAPQPYAPQPMNQMPPEAPKKSNKILIIVIGAVVGVILLLVLASFVMSNLRSAQKAAKHTTVIAYMGAISDGRCDEAWEFVDPSSPYASSKEAHDIDCQDATVKEIATYIVNNADKYTESTDDTGATVYTHSVMAAGSEGAVSFTVSDGKIYRISL